MLELKNIHVGYGKHIIYEDAYFCAHHNELTLVMGKSGSGKSTLHQLVTLHNIGKYDYYYDNENIGQLSYKQKQEFINKKMGIVNQIPAFIDDLTIKDHIALCQSLWDGYDIDEYIQHLEIQHVLNEYPQQLSGGEKIRVGILLAMIHQPEILVFDEPTASLDKHHSQLIIELLKEYAHEGHIVIVFTHDKLMKCEGDVVYFIEDKILNCVYQDHQVKKISSSKLTKKTTQHYLQYIYKMFNHKKILKVCMIVFMAIAIGLSCFSIFYGNSVIYKYQNELKNVNKAGVISKNSDFFDDTLYNNSSPIAKEELKNLEYIKHINKIWPYIMCHDGCNIISDNIINQFRVFQNQKLIAVREKGEIQYNLGTYNEEYDYSQKRLTSTFDVDEGIYIDQYFLYYLITGEIMESIVDLDQMKFQEVMSSINTDTEIEFPIGIPYYVESQEYRELYFKQTTIRMKIKGMYSGPLDFKLCKEFSVNPDIFYPLSVEKEYREKISQGLLPAIKESHGEIIKEPVIPFYPIYYQFSVDDNATFSEVKEEIEALGYRVYSEYYDKEVQVLVAEDMNKGVTMISALIMCVALMLFFGIKYNQKKEYQDFIRFFTNRGITSQKAKKILGYYFIYEAILCSVASLLTMGIIIYIFMRFIYQEFIFIHLSFFLFCIILSFVIEVGIPLLIVRGEKE